MRLGRFSDHSTGFPLFPFLSFQLTSVCATRVAILSPSRIATAKTLPVLLTVFGTTVSWFARSY